MHDEHDIQLSYREIIRACDSDDNWFTSIIEADIIHVSGDPQQATYNGYQLARIRRAHRIALGFAGLGARAADQFPGLLQDPADGPLEVLRAPEGGDGDRQPAHAPFLPVRIAFRRLRGRPYSRTCPPSAPTTMPSPPREETS